MATNLTRFEVVLPNTDAGTPADTAVTTFLTNMQTLTQIVMYTAYIMKGGVLTQQNIIYGLLTTAQQSTALGYLNTLNASLGYTVLCTINTVTQEP